MKWLPQIKYHFCDFGHSYTMVSSLPPTTMMTVCTLLACFAFFAFQPFFPFSLFPYNSFSDVTSLVCLCSPSHRDNSPPASVYSHYSQSFGLQLNIWANSREKCAQIWEPLFSHRDNSLPGGIYSYYSRPGATIKFWWKTLWANIRSARI